LFFKRSGSRDRSLVALVSSYKICRPTSSYPVQVEKVAQCNGKNRDC
jgi:hypothetical protein